MIEVDVVLVNMEERTAYCSDGITRAIFEMYDAEAQPTEDPDEAIAAVVKVGEDQYIVLNLAEDDPVKRPLISINLNRISECIVPASRKAGARPRGRAFAFQRSAANSDGFLEFLGGAEGNLLARLDLDRLAGRRDCGPCGRRACGPRGCQAR